MKSDINLKPLECEPTGRDVDYLVRISVWNGVDGYEGPYNLRDFRTILEEEGNDAANCINRVVIPKLGPVTDYTGDGIYGCSLYKTSDKDVGYSNFELLAIYDYLKQVKSDHLCVWQLLAAVRSEVRPDITCEPLPDSNGELEHLGIKHKYFGTEYKRSFVARRAWVCFSGNKEQTTRMYMIKKCLQRLVCK